MPEMSRDQFAARVVEIIRARFPLVKIDPAGEEGFAVSVNGAVAPLENLYRATILHPDDLEHHVSRWAVELLRAAEGTPDAGATFDDVKDRILPMLLRSRAQLGENVGEDADEDDDDDDDEEEDDEGESSEEHGRGDGRGIISQPLVEGLQIAYAIDQDRTIAYISRSRFAKWGVTLEQLHQTAIENLSARSEQIAAHAAQDENGRVNLILFQTMDGYDASRILLPTLHDRLREHLGSPFAAGIPNRDILLCFRDEPETVSRLKQQIAEDYQRMPHQVTDKLLLVTPDGIAPRP
jgi:Protein of unknown function (DUF1444)